MACLAGHVLVYTRCHCLFDFDMAILAGGFPLDMTHAAGPGLMAVNTPELLPHVHVFRKTRRLGEFLAKIAIPSSPFHGACVADKGAPAASGAVRWRGCPCKSMTPALARWGVVAVKAARVADVACLLLGYCLFMS